MIITSESDSLQSDDPIPSNRMETAESSSNEDHNRKSDYVCRMPIEFYDDAKSEVGETSELRDKCINEIVQWYDEHPEINANRDPLSVLYFLRGCKFNVDKTKQKVLRYYRMRRERIEWFENRDPFAFEINELLDMGVFLPLLTPDCENRLVVVIRTAVHNPRKHMQNDVFKTGKMILDYVLHTTEAPSLYGVSAIFDMQGVEWTHATALPPMLIKRAVESWENYPCRTKSLEFINAPAYLNVILNIFRSFMTAKMRSRVVVTKGISTSTADLPTDLGGTGPSYAELALHWKNVLRENAAWFVEDDKYKSIVDK